MAISGARIFHLNSNTRDIERSLGFYRDLLGFTAITQPKPSAPQPGEAFGLDEVLWDGFILQGDLGYAGLSLDLLEWLVPPTGGVPPRSFQDPGFHRLCFTVPDFAATLDSIISSEIEMLCITDDAAIVADPDGVPVEVRRGTDRRVSHVVVNCRDLDTSFAYYRDVLGLEVTHEPAIAPQASALAYGVEGAVFARSAGLKDRGSEFAILLVGFEAPSMPEPIERQAHHAGLFRMAWSTSDCAADELVVRAAGSVPNAATSELSVGEHLPLLRVLFWPGPDGECLELIEVTGMSS